MKKQRYSQFELIRLVAMFFVVTHHLIIKGADVVGYITPYEYSKDGVCGVLINSLVVGGVNLFVLITGWFGIKHHIRSIIRIFIDCAVFGLLSYCIVAIIENDFQIKKAIMSMSFHKNWFIISYLMLILASPIIEKSLENINRKQLGTWIGLLSLLNIVFGFIMGKVNTDGYNVINFIFLYYIARYIRKYSEEKNYYNIKKIHLFSAYIALSILLATIFIAFTITFNKQLPSKWWFGYNNPILIISTIAFFLLFIKLKIQSSIVNNISKGVFGTYLLHTSPYIIPIRNEFTHKIYVQYGYIGIFIESIVIFILCILLSSFINKINTNITNKISSQFKLKTSYAE